MSRPFLASSALPIAAMLAAMVCFQVGASFAKSLFASVGPQGATTLRLVFAAIILTAVNRPWRKPERPTPRWAVLGFGVAIACATLCFYTAISTIPLGVAIAIQFAGPLTLAVITSRRPTDFLMVALAAAGILMLLPWSATASRIDPVGIGFALAAAVGWAGYIVFGKAAGAGGQSRAVTLSTLVAAVIVAPFGFAHAGLALFDPALLPTAIIVALITTVVPISLEMFALGRLSTAIFGVLSSLEPAVGVMAGFLMLHEQLTALQLIAIAAIIAASAGTMVTHKVANAPVV